MTHIPPMNWASTSSPILYRRGPAPQGFRLPGLASGLEEADQLRSCARFRGEIEEYRLCFVTDLLDVKLYGWAW